MFKSKPSKPDDRALDVYWATWLDYDFDDGFKISDGRFNVVNRRQDITNDPTSDYVLVYGFHAGKKWNQPIGATLVQDKKKANVIVAIKKNHLKNWEDIKLKEFKQYPGYSGPKKLNPKDIPIFNLLYPNGSPAFITGGRRKKTSKNRKNNKRRNNKSRRRY